MKRHSSSFFAVLVSLFCFCYNNSYAQVDHVSSDKFSMQINGHTLKIPFYSSQDIFTADLDIARAIIVLHGTNREAGDHFNNMEAVVNNASMSDGTLIISPQFLTEDDINFHFLDNEHLYWSSGGWKSGSNSRNAITNPRPERMPSYAVMDSLFIHLARQFPNLKSIVFAGHSAGGQFSQRLAASSPMADRLCHSFDVITQYIVANPSSYAYMDGQRAEAGTTDQFSVPSTSCAEYNEWKYGLEDLFTYPGLLGVDSIRSKNKRRIVSYLLGEEDNNPNSSSLDVSCEALLQGAHRYERGEIFFNYLQHYYGNTISSTHEFLSVPNVGHNSFQTYSSVQGNYALFEKPLNFSCGTFVNVTESIRKEKLDIYPNPLTDVLNVSLVTRANENLELLIFDLYGRLMLTRSITINEQVDVSSLNSGMYILRIQANGQRIHKSFVVE